MIRNTVIVKTDPDTGLQNGCKTRFPPRHEKTASCCPTMSLLKPPRTRGYSKA